jgi:hypothetical protein
VKVLLVFLLLTGCRASSQDSRLNDLVTKEIGNDFSIKLNDSKTFALAWNKNQGNVNYVVIKLLTNSIILRKTNIHAEIAWQDDMHIKETVISGVFKKDGSSQATITLINVNDYIENKK